MMKNMREYEPIHIVGIGGIGMSAIAEVLHNNGVKVRGSDLKDGGNTRRLATKGIEVVIGHKAGNIEGASLVVLSSAVKDGNPELVAAKAAGLPVWSRADMLARLMENYRTVSVTGTHGKTTTTSMIAWIFEKAGLDPTVITGGIINDWGTNARIGKGEWFIVEADESDETFVKLPTHIGVVTNIDPEHLDYYGSVEAMHAAYRRFFSGVKPGGAVVAGIDHPVVREFAGEARLPAGAKLLRYGMAADADIRLKDVRANGGSVHLDAELGSSVEGGPRLLDDLTLAVPGHYNALNAMAAIAVATEVGIADDIIREALSSFHGVKRRFTRAGVWNGVTIYDDYAHHPAEIAAVLGAARGATSGRVIAVVQPHRYSRLKNLFDEFCGCFVNSDMVIVTPVYSAGEEPNGIDRDALVDGLRLTGHRQVMAVDGEDALPTLIASLAKPGDLVIGLGAGTITEWTNALPARLGAMQPRLDAAE
jgi:UDP-N-acetylmuramate--alanine ligase